MERLEVLKVFSSRIDAGVAKGYLESMGIESSISSDDADQLYPSLGAVKGVRLLVKGHDLKRARALLDKKGECS